MALGGVKSITLAEVSATRELRIDAHYHRLNGKIRELRTGIVSGLPIQTPYLALVENGKNIARTAYDISLDDPEYVYLSVAGLSQFVLQQDRCVPLRPPEKYKYAFPLREVSIKLGDVLLTRSGTPGIAWAMTESSKMSPKLIPSGFLIRVNCEGTTLMPTYLAGVLNHPAWRVWSSSLAAGKRQRNLSQEHLAQILIPVVSEEFQRKIGEEYETCSSEVENILADEVDICAIADRVLGKTAGLNMPKLSTSALTFDSVNSLACLRSPIIRMDVRFHRSDVQGTLTKLDGLPCVHLGSLCGEELIKNTQPDILPVEVEDSDARVVATSTIQAGQVVPELMKFTSEEEVENAGKCQIVANDLLITMDGEGSIGKAAVYEDDYRAVPDSHVGIVRLIRPDEATAIACFLNSSLGQAQFYVSTSGATGQTQVSKQDLLNVRIPQSALVHSQSVAEAYKADLAKYESPIRRTRRAVCRSAVRTTGILLQGNFCNETCQSWLSSLEDEDRMFGLLSSLTPSMF